jgi:HlyD family secretion protein
MRRSRIAVTAALAVAAAATAWYFVGRKGDATGSFRFVELSRGDIEYTVSATGALSAVRTVQVGTQVSGQISAILVDFNDRVRRGQLIARLDTTLLMQAVREAEAGLARAQAERDRREFDLRQATALWESRVISETEFRAAEFDARTAAASLASARSSLERAHQNLGFASIHSPVDGIVIERNVDVGQTVAASFSAPQLFLIAEDLRRMQILASVAEGDIGQITEGLETRFTVQAYPDRVFTGRVDQVRMQSKTQENVVNYTVSVEVENADGALLPGMTATVQFLVRAVRGVLRAPNPALRFRPPAALLAQAVRDTSGARSGPGGTHSELWVLDPDGRLRSIAVRTGLTDGAFTEVEGSGLSEGQRVVAAVAGSTSGTASNPFQQSRGPAGGPPPP